jgi:hypothetical protein
MHGSRCIQPSPSVFTEAVRHEIGKIKHFAHNDKILIHYQECQTSSNRLLHSLPACEQGGHIVAYTYNSYIVNQI